MVFARNGAKVVIADINNGQGQETVNIVEKSGGEVTFVKTDVSKDQEVQALIKKTVDTSVPFNLTACCNAAESVHIWHLPYPEMLGSPLR